MKIERVSKRRLKIDIFLLIPILLISLIGIVALLSTTITIDGSFGDTSIITKQLIFLASGFILFFLFSFLDISILRMWQIVLPIYLVTVALLILVLIFGPVVNNVQRWLVVGGIQIQPSEIAKVTVILTTATVLSYKDRYNEWLLFFVSLLLTLPMVILIYMQPSGSMSILTLSIWFLVAFTGLNNQLRNSVILLIIGLITSAFLFITVTGNWYYILLSVVGLIFALFAFNYRDTWKIFVIGALVVSILLGSFSTILYSNILKEYQRGRIETFINPTQDTQDLGFNVNQARIAIGSGQIFGKGFGNGTQSKRNFLPEHQTDFIFASFAEEFGLVGSLFLLAMFGIIIIKGLIASINNVNNPFFAMLLVGITMKILLEVFINIGTNTGTIPATGIPLPLVSAGGSITVMTLFSLGLIQSIMNVSQKDKNKGKIIDNYEFIN
ncbi:MAG: rod shape-determining protein RodA [Candidatus Dojkabacteria bacterium]|jgi:rod shape determining protein RodA|nr:rod shape-determining protein RodA [Candidatus Dojkabacteria bacterium]